MGSTMMPFDNDSLPVLAAEDINGQVESLTYDDYDYLYYEAHRARLKLLQRIFTEVITVGAIFNVFANFLIAYVIVRYKKLRLNKSNLFIANFNLLDSLFTILVPLTLRYDQFNGWWVFATVAQMVMVLGSIVMVIFVIIGWFLKTYYPQTSGRFDRRVGVIIACIYVAIGFGLGMGVEPYYHHFIFSYMAIGVLILFALYIVFMLVIDVLHFVKRRKLDQNVRVKNYPFILANVFFLSKLPFLICFALFTIHASYYSAARMRLFTGVCITGVLALMQGVYLLIVLYVFGEDYRVFFRHAWRCKRNGYTEERLDSSVLYSDGKITVDNEC